MTGSNLSTAVSVELQCGHTHSTVAGMTGPAPSTAVIGKLHSSPDNPGMDLQRDSCPDPSVGTLAPNTPPPDDKLVIQMGIACTSIQSTQQHNK